MVRAGTPSYALQTTVLVAATGTRSARSLRAGLTAMVVSVPDSASTSAASGGPHRIRAGCVAEQRDERGNQLLLVLTRPEIHACSLAGTVSRRC